MDEPECPGCRALTIEVAALRAQVAALTRRLDEALRDRWSKEAVQDLAGEWRMRRAAKVTGLARLGTCGTYGHRARVALANGRKGVAAETSRRIDRRHDLTMSNDGCRIGRTKILFT